MTTEQEPKKVSNISVVLELDTVDAMRHVTHWLHYLKTQHEISIFSASVYAFDKTDFEDDEEEPEESEDDEFRWSEGAILDPSNLPGSPQAVMKFEDNKIYESGESFVVMPPPINLTESTVSGLHILIEEADKDADS